MKNSRTPRLSDLIRQPAPAPTPPPAGGRPLGPAANAPDEAPFHAATPARIIEPTPLENEAHRDYPMLERWLEDIFADARHDKLECQDIFENVRAILERPRLLDALFSETFKTTRGDAQLGRKSLNVAVYSLRLGSALGLDSAALEPLGAAALLHKIGFVSLPADLVSKPGALNSRERKILSQHPVAARDLIAALGPEFATVATIVHQAHERGDGSGYPQGLREPEIRPEAQIIGLADVFEALIHPRAYRLRRMPFDAVKTLLERERGRFPRNLLREFIASFSVFPPFSYVRLNSKAIARVVDTEAGYPLRPQVEIVLDSAGRRLPAGQLVRLRENPLLYITGPVNEEDLSA